MKKQFITKGFTDGKQPRLINIEIIQSDYYISHLELHCDLSEVEPLIIKSLNDLQTVKDFKILIYKIKNKTEMKDIPVYSHEHINLRYFLAKKYTPHELLDSFEKIEHELCDIYENFRKSLKPPFDKII
jgi:hypothetical protein